MRTIDLLLRRRSRLEFFTRITASIEAEALQARLSIAALPEWCASVHAVREAAEREGEIETVWGVFRVTREVIRGGVRFALPGCPNAFAWTVTTDLPPDEAAVVIHATINRREHDPDFIESIETFVAEWGEGLRRGLTP